MDTSRVRGLWIFNIIYFLAGGGGGCGVIKMVIILITIRPNKKKTVFRVTDPT